MKKSIFVIFLLFISLNLFAEVKISTGELKTGIHYSVDSAVNIRKAPSLTSEKIGKVNLADKVEVLEKTEVYFESEGIYDCFYKVKCNCGIGYMFGGYISDNADNLLFDGENRLYFDKLYNYKITIPEKLSSNNFYKYAEDNGFIAMHYRENSKGDYTYVDFAYESPSLEELLKVEKVLMKEKENPKEFSFSKVILFSADDSHVVKNELVYSKIDEIKIIKNQFTNTSFISYKLLEVNEPNYIDATEFVTFQNGNFIVKRRYSNYARSGLYQAYNTFIMPLDKGGAKDTIRIIGKYTQSNEITEEYDETIFWNGKDFIDGIK